jgi:BirA family biotin operon repressor/biotin-[acetyl-CoA-carboxylase] ligase
LIFDEADSTNTQAVRFGDDPSHHGLVLLADVQTGGRGQYGRTWLCPPRSGVLMSVLLFPPPGLRRPALLTAWAAVSVCETLGNLSATIKWPNDVLVQGRKVCGILIECGASAGGAFRVVAGIGLNLNQTANDFTSAGLHEAGSLLMFTGEPHDRDKVARRLLTHLQSHYQRLLLGETEYLHDCWQSRLGLMGQRVTVESFEGFKHGRLLTLTWDEVVLDGEDGDGLTRLPTDSIRQMRQIPTFP